MGLSNELSPEAGSFSRHLNPHRCYQSEVLRLYFPCTRTLSCVVCLTPQLFLPVYPHVNVGTPGPPAATSPRVLSAQRPVSTPPSGQDECFFFNTLVVGLPYSLIFCQFWLFFVFKFVAVLLLVVHEGTVVHLPIVPPSWPEVPHKVSCASCVDSLVLVFSAVRTGACLVFACSDWQAAF